MSDITHSDELVTKQDLSDFYQGILPYLGGMPEVIANKFSRGDMFSTSEKMIGCWTDGKPLYQQTIITTTPSSNTVKTIMNTSGLSVKAVKTLYVNFTGGRMFSTTWYDEFYLDVENDKLVLEPTTSTTFVNREIGITIQYTKDSDSANSFKFADESDYSTSEKIIGTWIDGKPLYQKTISCETLPNNSTKNVAYNISNLNRIISISGAAVRTSGTYACHQIGMKDTANMINVKIVGTNIVLTTLSDMSTFTAYITLQYTKTTD